MPGVGNPRVVRVDEFEFELSDGRVFQHPVEPDPDEKSSKNTMTNGWDY